jgi:hypothetical protein
MAIQQSSLAQLEIKVVIAVDIPEIRACASLEIERDRSLHFADPAIYASGDAELGSSKELV